VRALVTGGAGFVGSHVADALVARGEEVVVVDNLSSGNRDNVPNGARLVEVDIRDEALAEVFAGAKPDVCFHLAAQADVITSVRDPAFDAHVNVIGTLRVLQATGDGQVVFTSTGGAIYGECERAAREDDPRRPLSPYGTSKLAGEEYLATWNRLWGTRHVVLRLGNVYGPRQLPSLEGGVVSIFLDRMAAGDDTQIFGDGNQSRDFVYVGDVARAMLAAVGQDGGVYNVASGRETSVNELHELCRRVSGSEREPTYAEARAGDVLRSVLDPGRANSELGWRPETSLEDGLRKTWAWVQERDGGTRT
jgi:UDP-glucose 4-epimerase